MEWKNSNGEFEQPPAGSHLAICIKVIDIGTQKSEYQGQANIRRQCIIGWELPNELLTEGDYKGKPFTVAKFYTASLNEKANLRKDLANWRGRDFSEAELQGFASKTILGKACMLSLTPNDDGKIRVTAVMALPKGMAVPKQVNPSIYFSLDEFDERVYDILADGFKKIITRSPEYQHHANRDHFVVGRDPRDLSDIDNSIPF